MWPFRTSIVDDDTVNWQIGLFEWLIEIIGPGRPISRTKLVVPGLDHFTFDQEKGRAFVQRVFDQVRAYAGIDPDVTFKLLPQARRQPDTINETTAVIIEKHTPLGTFRFGRDGVPQITYDPALERDPENLISTLAHELSHYLVPLRPDMPAEKDEYELLTDLCVAFLGFGVFLSNTRMERYVEGAWVKWRGGGYLPVNDRVMALALFLAIKDDGEDRRIAREFLRPHLRKTFDKAFRQLARFQSDIERLRALDDDARRRAVAADSAVESGPQLSLGSGSILGMGLPVSYVPLPETPPGSPVVWPASGSDPAAGPEKRRVR